MITFHDISGNSLNGMACVAEGNGDTGNEVLVLNLTKAPWLIPFSGVVPNSATPQGFDPGVEVSAAISTNVDGDVLLTFTFVNPLANNPNIGIAATFVYNSL